MSIVASANQNLTLSADADRLVDLVARLAANDTQLEIANRQAMPASAEHLRSAEEIARVASLNFSLDVKACAH